MVPSLYFPSLSPSLHSKNISRKSLDDLLSSTLPDGRIGSDILVDKVLYCQLLHLITHHHVVHLSQCSIRLNVIDDFFYGVRSLSDAFILFRGKYCQLNNIYFDMSCGYEILGGGIRRSISLTVLSTVPIHLTVRSPEEYHEILHCSSTISLNDYLFDNEFFIKLSEVLSASPNPETFIG